MGKNCTMCETCIYDMPIEDVVSPTRPMVLRADETCNYCGYLIKESIGGHNDKYFNACCGKSLIKTTNCSRPRTIDFRLTEGMDIEKPDWCPKSKGSESEYVVQSKETSAPQAYLSYSERRSRLTKLPPHLDWNQITVGNTYVVPSILGRERKVLFLKFKSDYCLVCNKVQEDGTVTNEAINIFKSDIDTNFIVEYKNF